MTNRKYLEDNKIAFDEAMAEFNKSGLKSFDEWLNKERYEWKFKVGDFLKNIYACDALRVVVGFNEDYMFVKRIMRNGKFEIVGGNCKSDYIPEEFQRPDIYYVKHYDQKIFEKVF